MNLPPALSPSDAPTAPSAVIDVDVPCVGCKYNLRTLPRDGVCPECGRSVEESWQNFALHDKELGELRANGLPWMRAMREGLTLACAAWTLSLIGLFYGTTGLATPYHSSFTSCIWLTPFIVVWMLSQFSAWKLMTARKRRWQLAVSRIALISCVLGLGLIFLNGSWLWWYGGSLHRRTLHQFEAVFAVTRTAGVVGCMCWPLVSASTFGRLIQLSRMATLRGASVLFVIVGVIVSVVVGVTVLSSIVYDFDDIRSDTIAATLIGPTGTMPMLWAGLVQLAGKWGSGNTPSGLLALLLIISAYACAFALGPCLFALRTSVNRAIQLSESPASSSRS